LERTTDILQKESRGTVEVLKRIESLLLKSEHQNELRFSSMRERLSEMDKKNDAHFDEMKNNKSRRISESTPALNQLDLALELI
jgi:hypothetical protein